MAALRVGCIQGAVVQFRMADQVSFILLAVSVLGVAHLVHCRALVVVSERIVQLELETVPFALAVGWQAVWLDG